MHNLWQGVDVGRIDGIKPFYKNHSISAAGTKLHIKVTGKNTAVVLVGEGVSSPWAFQPLGNKVNSS